MTIKIPGVDFLKSAFFEDEPKPESTPPVAEQPYSFPQAAPEPTQTPPVDNRVYQRLRELTDFASTKAGQAVNKYMPALLETVGESKAFAAAIKIAHTNDGLTDQDIAAAFTEMRAKLDSFQAEGGRQLDKFKETKVDATRECIRQNDLKIKQMQIDNAGMSKDFDAAQAQYMERRSTLVEAVAQRTSEIQREEQERTNLLKK